MGSTGGVQVGEQVVAPLAKFIMQEDQVHCPLGHLEPWRAVQSPQKLVPHGTRGSRLPVVARVLHCHRQSTVFAAVTAQVVYVQDPVGQPRPA